MSYVLFSVARAACPEPGDDERALLAADVLVELPAPQYPEWKLIAVHPHHPWFVEEVIRLHFPGPEDPSNEGATMIETESVFLPRGEIQLRGRHTVSYVTSRCGWLVYEGASETVDRLLRGEIEAVEQRRIGRMERRLGLDNA
jgi:hypothetical protein